MANHLIKICGIRDPAMAMQTAKAGADLIGIIFHPASPRYVSVNQARAISAAVKKAGASPVAVFVNHTALEMARICEAADIEIVQLHGVISRAQHHLLPTRYQRIYVQPVSENSELYVENGLQLLDCNRDIILIDHPDPGKGYTINRNGFHYDLPFPWLIAGGLSPTNVEATIKELKPNGVDVSSGVEVSKGNKDLILIQQFISSVRSSHHAA